MNKRVIFKSSLMKIGLDAYLITWQIISEETGLTEVKTKVNDWIVASFNIFKN